MRYVLRGQKQSNIKIRHLIHCCNYNHVTTCYCYTKRFVISNIKPATGSFFKQCLPSVL